MSHIFLLFEHKCCYHCAVTSSSYNTLLLPVAVRQLSMLDVLVLSWLGLHGCHADIVADLARQSGAVFLPGESVGIVLP